MAKNSAEANPPPRPNKSKEEATIAAASRIALLIARLVAIFKGA